MEFQYAPSRSIELPHLQYKEEVKITAKDVGLYDRDTRLTEYDKGTIALSNFSLYWYTEEVMIGFYCDQITKIDIVSGLLKRHPKIKIYFNESVLQLSFRGSTDIQDFYSKFLKVLASKDWNTIGGLHHIVNKKQQDLISKKELVTDAFSSLDSILNKMNELMVFSNSKNYEFQDLQVSEDINETVYSIILLVLKDKYVLSLLQLYLIVNKSNQYQTISPKELDKIIKNLHNDNKIIYRQFKGNSIVQSIDFNDDIITAKLLSLLDHNSYLNCQYISNELHLPFKTTKLIMDHICFSKSDIVVDDCFNETNYYKNKF